MPQRLASEYLPSEFYLAERWDSVAGAEPRDRRARIFKDYLALGVRGRWRYVEAARTSSLTDEQAERFSTIVSSCRSLQERTLARYLQSNAGYTSRIWVRTYQGQGLDPLADISLEDLEALTGDLDLSSTGEPRRLQLQLSLEDAEGWEDVLLCLPEIAECRTAHNDEAETHGRKIEDAKEEIASELLTTDDDELRNELRAAVHAAWVTGCFWTYDAEAAESGEALFTWVDQYGRVIRQVRTSSVSPDGTLIDNHNDTATAWWNEAEEGSDYEDGSWPT